MQNDIKKKINNLFARGASISEISKTLELSPGEVSKQIKKIFNQKKQSKNLLKFPIHKTIQKVKR